MCECLLLDMNYHNYHDATLFMEVCLVPLYKRFVYIQYVNLKTPIYLQLCPNRVVSWYFSRFAVSACLCHVDAVSRVRVGASLILI